MSQIDLAADPLEQFKRWYAEAEKSSVSTLDAMMLATVDESCRPSIRVVLYKGLSKGGFVFYSNYHSRKGREIAENPNAALTFYWPDLEKQVRVEGKLSRLTRQESDAYFASRPYESQISAWVSEQSQEIKDRKHLLDRYKKYTTLFPEGTSVRCPEYWGGYRLVPEQIEFWIGREHRLHDRFVYKKAEKHWNIVRLAP